MVYWKVQVHKGSDCNCRLCLEHAEKLLNKSELISKCRHFNKFLCYHSADPN